MTISHLHRGRLVHEDLLISAIRDLTTEAWDSHQVRLPSGQVYQFLNDFIRDRSIREVLAKGILTDDEAVTLVLAHFETRLLYPSIEYQGGLPSDTWHTKGYSQATLDSLLALLRLHPPNK
ncbi:hypothetical protein [Aeoliella mucimassa]|uniref:Uncharacterized protein n=1 Tax=Aeoliella mucimassa TaxID=2527972 RepID=A0A518ARA9_9BACT|nr:hypothetical protein [Aeoliella mucimassa]QDU57246.1 hypothetical protein Pan181_34600 [Aeoliella mucimassa]